MLQSFPKSYRFETDEMDAVCEMIGNAVPPLYARLAAGQVLAALKAREGKMNKAVR
jgi:site-specific DNA-cytosine methylase